MATDRTPSEHRPDQGVATLSAPIPLVAVVGRPNVGKSTLFNRVVGRRLAIVSEVPGTTRDRVVSQASWGDRTFLLVDTGGLQPEPGSTLEARVQEQARLAMEEAQVIVFLVDGREGVTPGDLEAADMLRRTDRPVVLGVNKADTRRLEQAATEFYELGLGEPIPLSAYHKQGVDDLITRVLGHLPPPGEAVEPNVLRLAILGRTNVGKSSLLNAILGQERVVVSEVPGTTRDAVDTLLEHRGHAVQVIDTAGIRRRGHIEPGVERYSVLRAAQALSRCDVALLVVDATEPMTAQDLHIAGYVLEAYRGLVVVVTKWDLAAEQGMDQADVRAYVRSRLRFAPYAPVRFTSAVTGEGVGEVLDIALTVYQERMKMLSRQEVQTEVMDAVSRHTPPYTGKRALKIYRVEQTGTNPPTFTFFVNDPKLLHFSYERYLENTLRGAFGFRGSRLRLVFRRRGEQP